MITKGIDKILKDVNDIKPTKIYMIVPDEDVTFDRFVDVKELKQALDYYQKLKVIVQYGKVVIIYE